MHQHDDFLQFWRKDISCLKVGLFKKKNGLTFCFPLPIWKKIFVYTQYISELSKISFGDGENHHDQFVFLKILVENK